MFYPYSYMPNTSQYVNQPYRGQPYYDYDHSASSSMERQRRVRGQATWTDGGAATRCGIPWSENRFMTAAVATNAPYRCGERLRIRTLAAPGNEISVMVVDKITGYPQTNVNLHRNAFEALGANINEGVIDVEVIPEADSEQEGWDSYVLGMMQTAYPGYNVINYQEVEKRQLSPQQTRETYEFQLQSPQEQITVRGSVIYNQRTNRVVSFDIKEVD
ncbi:rare lipoprotein A [Evansella caseinilytica]|uniref:Rare lipoprotein A n=1 Tax=Evansella caseinilytica TaxID=1503961 RepID=A0A1H3PEB3_9BACI|nr:RlpA-like double-psi beta-barrel domain-containing protein [Evansella caseinilytica]SDY99388.1 rare lipoprotein A [Evansella caseinilytica]